MSFVKLRGQLCALTSWTNIKTPQKLSQTNTSSGREGERQEYPIIIETEKKLEEMQRQDKAGHQWSELAREQVA